MAVNRKMFVARTVVSCSVINDRNFYHDIRWRAKWLIQSGVHFQRVKDDAMVE